MKKILTLFFAVCSMASFAQTTKGSFMIGGDGTLSFDNNDVDDFNNNSKSASFSLNPSVSYFLIKNFSVGLTVPFNMSKSKYVTETNPLEMKGRGYSIGIAPMIRYYIPVKKFFIATQAAGGWSYNKDKYETKDLTTGEMWTNENKSKWKGFGLAAGPAFFLNPYTSIEVLANYRFSNDKDYNLSSWYISAGFQIYLPSKKVE